MKGNDIRITDLPSKMRSGWVKKFFILNEGKINLFFIFLKKRPWQDFITVSFSKSNPQTMTNYKKNLLYYEYSPGFSLRGQWDAFVNRVVESWPVKSEYRIWWNFDFWLFSKGAARKIFWEVDPSLGSPSRVHTSKKIQCNALNHPGGSLNERWKR